MASHVLRGAAETKIQRPDLHFTKSPVPPRPPSPPSGQGPSAPTGNHHAVRVARETGRCCSHQPSGTEPFSQPPAMTCPGLTQVAKRGGGSQTLVISLPPPPRQLSGRRNFFLPPLSPMSPSLLHPASPPEHPSLLARSPPRSMPGAGGRGDSQVRRGRLVRLAPAEDGVSTALAHGSACFGSPARRAAGARLRPVLGAGWERNLPPRSARVSPARCCHRARCSAPRRAGGEGGGWG